VFPPPGGVSQEIQHVVGGVTRQDSGVGWLRRRDEEVGGGDDGGDVKGWW